MKQSTKVVLALGVGAAVTYGSYRIIKGFKEKKMEEEAISIHEAEAELKAIKEEEKEVAERIIFGPRDAEPNPEAEKVVQFMRYSKTEEDLPFDPVLENEDKETPTEEQVDYTKPLSERITEEDKILRYEPNSTEARDQFIRMELAEWVPVEDFYTVMLNLFEQDFQPTNDGDRYIKESIMDYRMEFFGPDSKWSHEVTYADLVLHYARQLSYNCNGTIREWAENLIANTEITVYTTPEELFVILQALNAHTYFNNDFKSFGLFGLNDESMDLALKSAAKNIEPLVTYDIEYNEFMKCVL